MLYDLLNFFFLPNFYLGFLICLAMISFSFFVFSFFFEFLLLLIYMQELHVFIDQVKLDRWERQFGLTFFSFQLQNIKAQLGWHEKIKKKSFNLYIIIHAKSISLLPPKKFYIS